MKPSIIRIYTDGACSPNPGPGGWGAVLLFDEERRVVELSGQEQESTNNRMELMAAVKALESLNGNCHVEIFTDSKYLQQGITSWIGTWQKNGWLTREKQAVKNKDLWQLLAEEIGCHLVTWHWVKGHGDDKWNQRADDLAVSVRKRGRSIKKERDAVQIYLGVTWKHSTDSGAWSAILCYHHRVKIIGGAVSNSSANQLYLHAAIQGIKSLKRVIPVQIFTKSGYFRDGLTRWMVGWKKRNWQTREGSEISNQKQWLELSRLQEQFMLSVVMVSDDDMLCKMQEVKELAREYEQL